MSSFLMSAFDLSYPLQISSPPDISMINVLKNTSRTMSCVGARCLGDHGQTVGEPFPPLQAQMKVTGPCPAVQS